MKKLTDLAFYLSIFISVLVISLESYRYPSLIQQYTPFSLSSFFVSLLIIQFSLAAKSLYKRQKNPPSLLLFYLGTLWILSQILIHLNQLMVSASENNTEILYVTYHFDIRPLLELSQIFYQAFILSFIFFADTIIHHALNLILNTISLYFFLRLHLKKSHLKIFTQYWQQAYFLATILFFANAQNFFLFSTSYFVVFLLVCYATIGIFFHKLYLSPTIIGTLTILTLTHQLSYIPKFAHKTILLFIISIITIILISFLKTYSKSPNESD